jgi:hypothetical protein
MRSQRSALRRSDDEGRAYDAPRGLRLPPLPPPEALLGSRAAHGLSFVTLFGLLTLTAACDKYASSGVVPEARLPVANPRVAAPPAAEPPAGDMSLSIPPADLRAAARQASAPLVPVFKPLAGAGGATVTQLVSFNTAPFPYDGARPGGGAFLDVTSGGARGHRAGNGAVLWENETFGDDRVLVHVPEAFDPAQPGVLVVFFHGFGATLSRDVWNRQEVPAQISASGVNAVLVAPQFAVDARDGSAGRFWEHGGFVRFLDETAQRLAESRGDPSLARAIRKMPIVLVAYSGGFAPAAYAIRDVASTNRVKGVVLLDAAYGELDTFAGWVAHEPSGFFVSAYTNSTHAQNEALKAKLAAKGIAYDANPENAGRGVTFLYTGAAFPHRDYVTRAWVENPIQDVLSRVALLGGDTGRVASRRASRRQRLGARD